MNETVERSRIMKKALQDLLNSAVARNPAELVDRVAIIEATYQEECTEHCVAIEKVTLKKVSECLMFVIISLRGFKSLEKGSPNIYLALRPDGKWKLVTIFAKEDDSSESRKTEDPADITIRFSFSH